MFGFRKKETKLEYNHITDFSKYKGYYCVIRRDGENLGLFSHYLTNAANIAACLQNDLIPVVDMKNAVNAWNCGKAIQENPWEYYFEQPLKVGLNDIDDSRVIYQTDVVPVSWRPTDSMEFLTNEIAVNYWRKFTKEYMQYNKKTSELLAERYQSTIQGYRTIGVLCRGTDYVKLRPQEHPIQPQIDKIIKDTQNLASLYHYEKIYLASEDAIVCEKFKGVFGDKLIISAEDKIRDTSEQYLNSIYQKNNIDIYKHTLNYLASIYVLSKCNALIAGRTSGSIAAYILSDGYEYSSFYNLGRYRIHNFMPSKEQ